MKIYNLNVIYNGIYDLPKHSTLGSAGIDLRADFSRINPEDIQLFDGAKLSYDWIYSDIHKDIPENEYKEILKSWQIILPPMSRVLIPTCIKIELPIGYEAQIRPRSGLGLNYGLTVLNTPGTVDADYRGEVGVILINLSGKNQIISQGDRIAQMVINSYSAVELVNSDMLSETDRNEGGFGHTGKQ